MEWRPALAEAGALVLPVECAGCGRWDVALCPACTSLLLVPPARCEEDAPLLGGGGTTPALPTWSLGSYRGALRAVVLSWKNHRRQDVAPAVLAAARHAAETLAHDPDLLRALATGGAAPVDVVVVPAPSGWRRRLAGRLVAADLADAVARGLAAGLPDGGRAGPPHVTRVLVVDLLRRRGGRAHQSGMGARSRSANRHGTVVALTRLPRTAVVVLVDDVVTTGATLAACVTAVDAVGSRVVGAFVLASTPAPGRVAGRLPR